MKYFSGFLVLILTILVVPLTFPFLPLNALTDPDDIYQSSTSDNSFGSLSRILVIEDEVEDEEVTIEEEESDKAGDEEVTIEEEESDKAGDEEVTIE
ncbi:MAG: hypothetical protein ACE5SW_03210, partial [Nitrososphaeraceae archaeon]